MAITKAMLDAERERTTLHKNPAECIAAGRGWDACLAFLREHGEVVRLAVPVPDGCCSLCGEPMNGAPFRYHAECPTDKRVELLTFVRVEIPAE